MKPRLLFALLPLLPLATVPAAADFKTDTRTVKLDYLQNEVTVIFETDGIGIEKVTPLCDCITAHIDGSRLIARVDSSKFSRDIDKQIDARTADGKTTRLTIRFSVPALYTVSSPSLVWQKGSERTPQVLRITIPKGSPVHNIERAELVGKGFDYEPRIIRRGREYTITVTPQTTDKPVLARLRLVTDCSDYRARCTIYLQVKR